MTAQTIAYSSYTQTRGTTEWGTRTSNPKGYNSLVEDLGAVVNSHASDIDALVSSVTSNQGLNNTSTSAISLSTGNKSFVVATTRPYQAGQYILASMQSTASYNAFGTVASYSHPTLTINVISFNGTGSASAWNISGSSPPNTSFDINGLTALTDKPASDDQLAIYDTSATANKKMAMLSLEKWLVTITEN